MRAVVEDDGAPELVDVQAASARRPIARGARRVADMLPPWTVSVVQAAPEATTDEPHRNRLRRIERRRSSPMSCPAVDPPQVFSSPRSELSPPHGAQVSAPAAA